MGASYCTQTNHHGYSKIPCSLLQGIFIFPKSIPSILLSMVQTQ